MNSTKFETKDSYSFVSEKYAQNSHDTDNQIYCNNN